MAGHEIKKITASDSPVYLDFLRKTGMHQLTWGGSAGGGMLRLYVENVVDGGIVKTYIKNAMLDIDNIKDLNGQPQNQAVFMAAGPLYVEVEGATGPVDMWVNLR